MLSSEAAARSKEAVPTYRKGANAVKDRLEAHDRRIEELQARFNELASAHVVFTPFDIASAPSRNGGPSLHEGRELRCDNRHYAKRGLPVLDGRSVLNKC